AVLAGDRDLAEGVVQLKDLTTGEQNPVALDALPSAAPARRFPAPTAVTGRRAHAPLRHSGPGPGTS
ncbi:hypothetical protein, partial [Kitasatospora sp. NPDC088351]|uniref:hypothetical protein n=1 Tax=Kitasatospora sp. NPDC088351 TaxID=3155180 RepID=UPI00343BBD68